jgi:formylglycine-generating enzyme
MKFVNMKISPQSIKVGLCTLALLVGMAVSADQQAAQPLSLTPAWVLTLNVPTSPGLSNRIEYSADGNTWSNFHCVVTPPSTTNLEYDITPPAAQANWSWRVWREELQGRPQSQPFDGMVEIRSTAGSGAVTFQMGDANDNNAAGNEFKHQTSVSPFFVDVNPVTYSVWTNVYQWAIQHGYQFDRRGAGRDTNDPVQTVTWFDAVKWCNARTEMENTNNLSPAAICCYFTSASKTTVYRTGRLDLPASFVNWANSGYRLPTEAEWECAGRGGSNDLRFPWGNTISHSQANYYAGWLGGLSFDLGPDRGALKPYNFTSPVGVCTNGVNGFGLNDMAGNVWQWCWDRFGRTYYQTTISRGLDPRGPDAGTTRVIRGGAWYAEAGQCRVANRETFGPASIGNTLGFRCVRSSTGGSN